MLNNFCSQVQSKATYWTIMDSSGVEASVHGKGNDADFQPPKRQKKFTLIQNKTKRNKADRRTLASLEKKINDWWSRTGMAAILITVKDGQPCFTYPEELENNLSPFVNNEFVQKKFMESISSTGIKETEKLILDKDLTSYNVKQLRKFVVTAVKSCSENLNKKVMWREPKFRPSWWPEEVLFANPNNEGKQRKGDLVRILQEYQKQVVRSEEEEELAGFQAESTSVSVTVTVNDWEPFEPGSNALWLHYLADKMLKKKKYPKKDKEFETKLKRFLKEARKCSSATEIVQELFEDVVGLGAKMGFALLINEKLGYGIITT